jgi:hypothetical protein
MTCDRAQDLFSDYIEGALDRPLANSMEAHLAGCLACQREIDALRATWEDLEALPLVAPPPGLVEQTLAAIHREQEAAQRPPAEPVSWLAWLRSLSPVRVALASSLATLIVAGALLYPRVAYDGFGFGTLLPAPPRDPMPSPAAAPRPRVSVTVEYGALSGETQDVVVVVRSDQLLKDADVTLRRLNSGEFINGGKGTMRANVPYRVDTVLPRSSAPQVLLVDIRSAPSRYEKHFYCAIPFERPERGDLVSLTLTETSLSEALKQMAEKTGRPVVADAAVTPALVTVDVPSSRPADDVWATVLEPLNLRAVQQQGTYEVVPKQ